MAVTTEATLFDGQRIRFVDGRWECQYGDEWAPVVPDSVLALAIESDEVAQAIEATTPITPSDYATGARVRVVHAAGGERAGLSCMGRDIL